MKKISYNRIKNTHIRENRKKRSIFDKVNEIKELQEKANLIDLSKEVK